MPTLDLRGAYSQLAREDSLRRAGLALLPQAAASSPQGVAETPQSVVLGGVKLHRRPLLSSVYE
jgi:hypothetical protein